MTAHPPPSTPFLASRLKIQRAAQHVAELQQEIGAYIAREPVRITASLSVAMPGYLDWQIESVESPPPALPAIMGDAAHNLRAALDLLAVDLVRLNKGNTNGVYFPFAVSAAELDRAIKDKNMHRAAPEVVDLVRALKPYSDGNVAMRHVHDLDVMDKHKAILPAIGYVKVPGGGLGYDQDNLSPRKLGSGTTLISWIKPAPPPIGTSAAPFKVVFSPHSPLADQDIAETFHRLVEEFSRIVDAFEALCFGASAKG